MTTRAKLTNIKAGDWILHRGVNVEILRDAEPTKDRFNRDMVRFWARRTDTDAEGWITFGPDATVEQL